MDTQHKPKDGIDSPGESLAHEMLGHGMHISSGQVNNQDDAIRMGNLYRRAQGINTYRDGTDHATGQPLSRQQASGLPSIYQGDYAGAVLSRMIDNVIDAAQTLLNKLQK
jgi:hypothetical protein